MRKNTAPAIKIDKAGRESIIPEIINTKAVAIVVAMTVAIDNRAGLVGFIAAAGWYTRLRAPSGTNFKSGHYPNSNLDFGNWRARGREARRGHVPRRRRLGRRSGAA